MLPALLLVCLALVGPWIAPRPIDVPVTAPYAEPGSDALLGGDQLGRDVLSRLLAGGRDLVLSSLLVAVLVTGSAAVLGAIGALRPRVGRLVERTADVVMLLPAVLGILLVTLSWPDGGRLAVIAAAVVLGVPYAVRLATGARARSPHPATSRPQRRAANGCGTWYCARCCRTCGPPSSPCSACASPPPSTWSPLQDFSRSVPNPQPPASDRAVMIRENSPGILLNPWAVVAPSAPVGLLALSVNLAAATLAPQTGRKAVTVL